MRGCLKVSDDGARRPYELLLWSSAAWPPRGLGLFLLSVSELSDLSMYCLPAKQAGYLHMPALLARAAHAPFACTAALLDCGNRPSFIHRLLELMSSFQSFAPSFMSSSQREFLDDD